MASYWERLQSPMRRANEPATVPAVKRYKMPVGGRAVAVEVRRELDLRFAEEERERNAFRPKTDSPPWEVARIAKKIRSRTVRLEKCEPTSGACVTAAGETHVK